MQGFICNKHSLLQGAGGVAEWPHVRYKNRLVPPHTTMPRLKIGR